MEAQACTVAQAVIRSGQLQERYKGVLRKMGIPIPAPGCVGCSSLIPDSIECVQHGHVRGQSLLCDHVADKHHPVIIGQLVSPLPQLYHL